MKQIREFPQCLIIAFTISITTRSLLQRNNSLTHELYILDCVKHKSFIAAFCVSLNIVRNYYLCCMS